MGDTGHDDAVVVVVDALPRFTGFGRGGWDGRRQESRLYLRRHRPLGERSIVVADAVHSGVARLAEAVDQTSTIVSIQQSICERSSRTLRCPCCVSEMRR